MSVISRKKFFADGVQDLCALAGTALLSTGLVRLAFGAEAQDEILVALFLRGACDGLNFARCLWQNRATRPLAALPVNTAPELTANL